MELSIRHLENKANKNASIFNRKIGVSISIDKLKNKEFGEYDSIFYSQREKDITKSDKSVARRDLC